MKRRWQRRWPAVVRHLTCTLTCTLTWALTCTLTCALAGTLTSTGACAGGLAATSSGAYAADICPPPLPSTAAKGPARDRGLLWRVTRDGRSSWLFGTLHVGKPAWARLGPRVTAALQASDVLAVEIDPGDPAEVLPALDTSLTQLEDPSGRRVLARLVRAWERGDLHTLSTYEQWCACATTMEERAFMRRLNDERNPGLADGIEAQHRAGQRVFAAVGALHMTGPAALPWLLARRGFRVERIVFGR